MKRVFIIHRWEGGSYDDWRPWLKNELERRDFEVHIPDMPDTEVPVIDKWVNHLSNIVGVPNNETYFIGHSIGCQAIIRYLETINTEVGGALFVAGWFNLENLEDEEVKKIAEPWINNKIDFEKIKLVLPKSILIISENDPYGAFKENTEKFGQIMTHAVVLPNAGHITNEKQPEILDQFLSLIK